MSAEPAPATANCPLCGHLNEFTWQLCDGCGQPLPWARPKQAKPIDQMSDDELAARFVGVTPREPHYLTTRQGKKVLWVVLAVVGTLISIVLQRLLFSG